jgi:hypothetical protein
MPWADAAPSRGDSVQSIGEWERRRQGKTPLGPSHHVTQGGRTQRGELSQRVGGGPWNVTDRGEGSDRGRLQRAGRGKERGDPLLYGGGRETERLGLCPQVLLDAAHELHVELVAGAVGDDRAH